MPSHVGSVTESSLAVQIRSFGTGTWKRNQSVPGVQSRPQYSRGWSARICRPDRMMNSMKNMFRKCCSCSHQGKPESTTGVD